MKTRNQLLKTIYTGVDIGQTFFMKVHEKSDILTRYNHEDLRILTPKWFIEILSSHQHGPVPVPIDPGEMFKFMNIEMLPSPYDKIIIYHVDHPVYTKGNMYVELDIDFLVTNH